jgi:hypothetical protein
LSITGIPASVSADYLIVGGGAMGLAFADTLLDETSATMAIVDRHHAPGGHWNDAYPFVRLHQPSANYGVNSRPLGSDRIDDSGWNRGLYELASAAEVCAYFDAVMRQRLLPSGRVQYFPMCDYRGDGRFTSLVAGSEHRVEARVHVDATYMNVMVPATRGPLYEVAAGVACVPPNGLPLVRGAYRRYVLIGAGKTAMDAGLWLLGHGVPADAITWVRPRDPWVRDRASFQPGAFADDSIGRWAREMQAIAQSSSVDDLFARLEACGQMLRFDTAVRPTMFRCASVSLLEFEHLRRIRDVVRLGHVRRIDGDGMHLDGGRVACDARTLFVDCSADGLQRRPPVPVFAGNRLTLQAVRTCQQVFSAAFIGHVEARGGSDAEKNDLCAPVPHPGSDIDYLRVTRDNARNARRWARDPELQAWLQAARLNGFKSRKPSPAPAGAPAQPYFDAALAKVDAYLAAIDAPAAAAAD